MVLNPNRATFLKVLEKVRARETELAAAIVKDVSGRIPEPPDVQALRGQTWQRTAQGRGPPPSRELPPPEPGEARVVLAMSAFDGREVLDARGRLTNAAGTVLYDEPWSTRKTLTDNLPKGVYRWHGEGEGLVGDLEADVQANVTLTVVLGGAPPPPTAGETADLLLIAERPSGARIAGLEFDATEVPAGAPFYRGTTDEDGVFRRFVVPGPYGFNGTFEGETLHRAFTASAPGPNVVHFTFGVEPPPPPPRRNGGPIPTSPGPQPAFQAGERVLAFGSLPATVLEAPGAQGTLYTVRLDVGTLAMAAPANLVRLAPRAV